MDYSNLQKTLAENKVYDAWQYVESLKETLAYMNASSALIEKVYAHRLEALAYTTQQILNTAIKTGRASITTEVLGATKLDIGGFEIDDAMFLKKTTLEFFHYARLSMDILFQIINAALLGDQAIGAEDKAFIGKLLSELDKELNFHTVKALLDANKATPEFQYLQAFDNHIKHIKTVLVNVNSSFLIGNKNSFEIANFDYGGKPYPIVDAITQVRSIQTYVENTIAGILFETQAQVPNCLGTQKRLQELHFTMQMQENAGKTDIDFISFFIYVNADISELPQEVNVYPLIVKPNDEIYSFDFRCEEIFIKRKTDDAIIGVATLKNGLTTREVYRSFSVNPCGAGEYVKYLDNFKQKYPQIIINFYALEGNIICYNPNNAE